MSRKRVMELQVRRKDMTLEYEILSEILSVYQGTK